VRLLYRTLKGTSTRADSAPRVASIETR
jgi:hypothetical protein